MNPIPKRARERLAVTRKSRAVRSLQAKLRVLRSQASTLEAELRKLSMARDAVNAEASRVLGEISREENRA